MFGCQIPGTKLKVLSATMSGVSTGVKNLSSGTDRRKFIYMYTVSKIFRSVYGANPRNSYQYMQ